MKKMDLKGVNQLFEADRLMRFATYLPKPEEEALPEKVEVADAKQQAIGWPLTATYDLIMIWDAPRQGSLSVAQQTRLHNLATSGLRMDAHAFTIVSWPEVVDFAADLPSKGFNQSIFLLMGIEPPAVLGIQKHQIPCHRSWYGNQWVWTHSPQMIDENIQCRKQLWEVLKHFAKKD